MEDRISFSHLASSVVLNMVADLLKKEFKQVGHLCSVILGHNPKNVKPLLRRANAAIGLGKYELVIWDLRMTHEVDPYNQDVERKCYRILRSQLDNNHGQER